LWLVEGSGYLLCRKRSFSGPLNFVRNLLNVVWSIRRPSTSHWKSNR